jgi:hypothetical protein
MTNMEKLYVALDRRVNPPKCHYDKVAVLQEPSKDGLFTPFYRCAQRDSVSIASMILFSEVTCVIHIITLELQHYHFQRGFPACDFEEYIYGPKSHWPAEKEAIEFATRNKPWPCLKMLDRKCKCGIKAHEGFVPSELGWGHYCGNGYGGPNELFMISLNPSN